MGIGFLKVQLYEGDHTVHGDQTTVQIWQDGTLLHTLQTDESGTAPAVEIDCPCLTGEPDSENEQETFTTVDVIVPAAHGFIQNRVLGVQIFDGITSILDVQRQPHAEGGPAEIVIHVPREHGVDIDRDIAASGNFPPVRGIPNPDDAPGDEETVLAFDPEPDSIPLANEVVIPDFITVHLGVPSANARNVRVPFRDYIVNVACSEIYPFWERAAIEANVHAQVSFALNRLFTHWYRSRGHSFDITNSTQFDQMFIEGRGIFQNVQQIVDGIFNQFIRRPGRREPFFAAYCNGTTSTCAGLSQHGSQELAQRGFSPLQILRYYYPVDINIVQSTNFGPRNPGAYPGTPLRQGSTGEDVRRLQLYLNRISGNWWIPAIQNPNGVFGADTRDTVIAFQRLFNLAQDGIVGPITWYEITRIYVAARNLAELTSEGQRYSIGNNPPTAVLRQGARGAAVVELQFLLNFIGTFYDDIPFVIEDGVFRDSTRVSVLAFQSHFGLAQDGVVGPLTWAELYEVYRSIRQSTPMPPPSDDIPPFPGVPLQVGSRGDDVRRIQTMLNRIGQSNPSIERLAVDGIFGPRTQAAVREFQRIFGFLSNGVVDRDTWYGIVEEYNRLQVDGPVPPPPPPPPPPLPPFPGTLLRNGSRGENVRLMQQMLNSIARVFPIIPGGLATDGIFGPLTEASVRAFQTFFGLNSDGIIGPITWSRIVSVHADLPSITAPAFPGNFQIGARGENVRILQQNLNDLAPFYPAITRLAVDGIFGPITQGSVTAFQRAFGMTPNGVVNATTWNLLVSMRNLLTQTNVRAAVAPVEPAPPEAEVAVEAAAFPAPQAIDAQGPASVPICMPAPTPPPPSTRMENWALVLAWLLLND